jgi:hypothetical protein
MKLSDLNILYINLERNKDRLKHIQNEFEKLNLTNVTRIEAIDGQTLPEDQKEFCLSRRNFKTMCSIPERIYGRVGCYLSHIKALDYAIENKFENVLIMEDDAYFKIRKDVELPKFPESADLLYLGGTFWKQEPELGRQATDWINIKRKYLKMAGCFGLLIPTLNKIKMCREIFKWVKPSAIDNLYINHIQSLGHSYFLKDVIISHSDKFVSNIGYSKKMLKNKFFYE